MQSLHTKSFATEKTRIWTFAANDLIDIALEEYDYDAEKNRFTD